MDHTAPEEVVEPVAGAVDVQTDGVNETNQPPAAVVPAKPKRVYKSRAVAPGPFQVYRIAEIAKEVDQLLSHASSTVRHTVPLPVEALADMYIPKTKRLQTVLFEHCKARFGRFFPHCKQSHYPLYYLFLNTVRLLTDAQANGSDEIQLDNPCCESEKCPQVSFCHFVIEECLASQRRKPTRRTAAGKNATGGKKPAATRKKRASSAVKSKPKAPRAKRSHVSDTLIVEDNSIPPNAS